MTRLGFKPLNDVSWLSVLVYSLTADLATWFPLNSITVGCWLHDCHLEMLALVSKASKTRTWWPLQPLICRTVVLPLQAELQHTCNRSIPSLLGACDGENCFKQSGPRSGGTSERHSHRALPDLKQHGWQQGNPGTASANPGLLNTPYLGRAAVVAGISDAALVKVKPVT